jgi:hypothetical protein
MGKIGPKCFGVNKFPRGGEKGRGDFICAKRHERGPTSGTSGGGWCYQRGSAPGRLTPSGQQCLVKTGGRLVEHAPLLAAAGGKSPDPPPVRVDAPTDLSAARANRLTDVPCRRPWAKRGPKGKRSVAKNVVGRTARHNRGRRTGVSTRDPYGEESGPKRALVGVGCDRSKLIKSEMSAQCGHRRFRMFLVRRCRSRC